MYQQEFWQRWKHPWVFQHYCFSDIIWHVNCMLLLSLLDVLLEFDYVNLHDVMLPACVHCDWSASNNLVSVCKFCVIFSVKCFHFLMFYVWHLSENPWNTLCAMGTFLLVQCEIWFLPLKCVYFICMCVIIFCYTHKAWFYFLYIFSLHSCCC